MKCKKITCITLNLQYIDVLGDSILSIDATYFFSTLLKGIIRKECQSFTNHGHDKTPPTVFNPLSLWLTLPRDMGVSHTQWPPSITRAILACLWFAQYDVQGDSMYSILSIDATYFFNITMYLCWRKRKMSVFLFSSASILAVVKAKISLVCFEYVANGINKPYQSHKIVSQRLAIYIFR